MAWTQSDLDKLNQAIATGAKRVKFQGHETEFRSLDEMFSLKEKMEREINASQTGSGIMYAEYHSGK